jgi:hypothetical protein
MAPIVAAITDQLIGSSQTGHVSANYPGVRVPAMSSFEAMSTRLNGLSNEADGRHGMAFIKSQPEEIAEELAR